MILGGRNFTLLKEITKNLSKWRPDLELNQTKRICNPLRNHSAIQPSRLGVVYFEALVIGRIYYNDQARRQSKLHTG